MKIYKKVWRGSTAGSPNRNVNAVVTIPINKRKVVKVSLFPEGLIHRVFVKQVSGTNKAFTIRLLETSLPYGDDTTNADYNAATAANPEVFDVIAGTAGAAQSAASGAGLDYQSAVGMPFITQDSDTQSDRGSNLYLVIIPAATSDETTWEVTVVSSNRGR